MPEDTQIADSVQKPMYTPTETVSTPKAYERMKRGTDLTGQRFTRLLVTERYTGNKTRGPLWKCLCDCGNTTLATGTDLRRGRHKSCGCYRGGATANSRIEKIVQDGYVFIWMPEHPRANKRSGRIREHIVVMEKILGRYLLPDEEVHHKNAIRGDNRPENLELWTKSQPAGARVSDQVEWAKMILERYKDTNL